MIIHHLHEWNLSTSAAIALQRRLASQVCRDETGVDFNYIAGVDISSSRLSAEATAAVVVLSYPELEPVEEKTVSGRIDFPYVPGLLSFREAPLITRAFEHLTVTPHLVIVDGQGIAHPRRFGIAAHLGLILDTPTIGCAKSRLCGTCEEPAPEAGCFTGLRDGEEVIGAVVRTRRGVRPVYVSVGHKISLEQAVEWTLKCCKGFRLPEPTRLAHQLAGKRQREIKTVQVV